MRNEIRKFISQVEWATPDNVSYLLKGTYDTGLYRYYQKRLEEMTLTQNKDKALRKIRNANGAIAYTLYKSKKKSITSYQYWHDRKLRNCLARFANINGYNQIQLGTYADAHAPGIMFELDNGTEAEAEITDKIRNYYSGQGQFRAIFWMSHIEGHNNEQDRLKKIFDIVAKVLHHKPNRVLANTYTDYLKSGNLYNYRREKCVI